MSTITITGSAGNVAGGDMNTTTTTTTAAPVPTPTPDLATMIAALHAALDTATPEQAQAVDAVREMATTAAAHATREAPNRALVNISADGLMMAAQGLTSALPAVLPLARSIAEAIRRMVA